MGISWESNVNIEGIYTVYYIVLYTQHIYKTTYTDIYTIYIYTIDMYNNI